MASRIGAALIAFFPLASGCSDTAEDAKQGQGASSSALGGGGGSGAGANGTGGDGGGRGLFQPSLGTTWQWQLSGLPLDTSLNVAAYDVDLFTTSAGEMTKLHADGRTVICYFSAGSWEDGRPDSGSFPASVKGGPLEQPFQGELWVDIRTKAVRDIMQARLDKAAAMGCDAVEPDNVDGYDNTNGLGLSASDQLDYNRWIADQAHARGLSVGLKNDLAQLAQLVDHFDWALNEQCHEFTECDAYKNNFIAAGKAVFHAEYAPAGDLAKVCAVTKPLGLSTLLKKMDLDAWQLPCP